LVKPYQKELFSFIKEKTAISGKIQGVSLSFC